MTRGGCSRIVLDVPAVKVDAHLPALAATEHSRRRALGRGRKACPYSSRECISKVMTASPVAPLVRVDGKCMGVDGPTLKTTRRLSVLAARAATGAPTVTAVTWPVLRKYFCVPQFGTGYELNIKQVTCALLALWEVHRYVRTCLAPTQSGAVVRKSIGAVGRAE